MNDQEPESLQSSAFSGGDNTASYHKRFLAWVIDVFLIAIMLAFVMQYMGLGIDPGPTGDLKAAQAELLKKLEGLSSSQALFLSFSPIMSFFILHGYLLYQSGQTIGKKIMGIAIVTLDNQKPAFFQLIGQRYCSQWVMGMLPFIGLPLRLLDVMLIFRGDKRCLHDLIARTKVIDLSIKAAATPNNSFVA